MTDTARESDAVAGASSGSLADLVAPPALPEESAGWPRTAWMKIGILAALFIGFTYWQFPGLIGKWYHDSNWSHGFLIPLFSLFLLFVRRNELLAAKRKPCLLGLPIVLGSIAWQIVAYYPLGVPWLYNLGMVVMILGLVLYLAGWQVFKITWVPIAYLALAMPLPDMLYSEIALPLQNLAADWSTRLLMLIGVEIRIMPGSSSMAVVSLSGQEYPLTVAEACSGVRSLMAFVALSVAFAYIEDRPVWQRSVLVLASIPIAIACNVLRVALTCSMFVLDRPDMGRDFMHAFMGLMLLIPAVLLLFGLGAVLKVFYVEEDDEEDQDTEPAPPATSPAEEARA